MDFDTVSRMSHPAELVLETMIERMEAIVPFLPSVERIETLEENESSSELESADRH